MPEPSAICPACGHHDEASAVGRRCPKDGLALVDSAEVKPGTRDAFLGRVMAGKYPIVGRIGAGVMGSVYRALQEPVGREVAIKVIKTAKEGEPDYAQDEALRERFVREAKIVARLSHPATVTLHDYGVEPDGTLYMVLELVKGKTLAKVLAAERWMAPGRAVALVYQVLQSLAEAHAQGLVHRDLKPANIMVVRGPFDEELVKVLDFGVARADSRDLEGRHQTMAGTLIGSPRYMSPEQARGETATAASDLYSVGTILYELLCGTAPFPAKDPMDALLAQIESPVPPLPPEFGVPAALEAAVRKSLEKSPALRFGTALEMAKALMEARSEGLEGKAGEVKGKQTLILAPSSTARVADPESIAPAVSTALPPSRASAPAPVTAPILLTAPAPKPIPLSDLAPEPEGEEEFEQPDAEEDAAGQVSARSSLPVILGGVACALALVAGGALYLSRSRSVTPPVNQLIPDPEPAHAEPSPPVVIPPQPDFDPKPSQPVEPPVRIVAPVDPPGPGVEAPKPVPEPRPRPTPPPLLPKEGRLDVSCIPGCRVYVDGVFRGDAPVRGLVLSAGKHLLWAKDPQSGGKLQREVVIVAGRRTAESLEF